MTTLPPLVKRKVTPFSARGSHLSEDKGNRVTIKIDGDVVDALFSEIVRARKAEGKKPSYSEIIRRLLARYVSDQKTAGLLEPVAGPAMSEDELLLVEGFLLLLRDRRPIAQPSRDGVLGLLKNWIDKAKAKHNHENHAS